MNPKTEVDSPARIGNSNQFGRGFLSTMSLLTFVVLVAIVSVEHSRQSLATAFDEGYGRAWTIFPWIVAGGRTIANGLRAFSGEPLNIPSNTAQLTALASLLLGFVICPTVYLFRWRDRHLRNVATSTHEHLTLPGLFFNYFTIVTLFLCIAIVPVATFGEFVRSSIRSAQAVQTNKDNMINDLDAIVVDLQQYRILPKSLGGGDGSCIGYNLAPGFAQTRNGVYSITVEKEKAVIVGRSLLFPSSSIKVELDAKGLELRQAKAGMVHGGPWHWMYEGKFL
ncbi:MAG TPA: hypothetical protein VI758_01600 [Bacteroidota bacterium]